MMDSIHNLALTYPVLYIQYQRALSNGRTVVSGPGYRANFLSWRSSDNRLLLHDPANAQIPYKTFLDYSQPHYLTSDELFGFDPVTTQFPRLKASQNYHSAVLANVPHGDLIGEVVLPAFIQASVAKVRVELSITNHILKNPDLLLEITQAESKEHFVWRFEGSQSGFVVVPVNQVSGLPGPVEMVVVKMNETKQEQDALRVFGFLPSISGEVEIPLGEMIISGEH